jgi:hypothetical protein
MAASVAVRGPWYRLGVRLVAGVLATAFVCSVSGAVEAETPRAPDPPDQPLVDAIDVSGGATCLDQARLQAEVQTWLGRDRLRADLHVHVQGDGSDPHAVMFRIVLAGKPRERRFDDLPTDCEDATAVVGLAMALAIDANVVTAIVLPTAPAPVAALAPERKLFVAQAAGGFDVVPGASVGAVVGVEYGLGAWLSLRLDLMTQVSWNNAVDGTTGVFDVVAAGATPQLCAGGDVTGAVRFELCSGVLAGLLHAQGRGYTVSHDATGPWIMAQGGVRLFFVAGIPWALDVDGIFPIHAPAFRAEDGQGVDRYRDASLAGAMVGFGPSVPF